MASNSDTDHGCSCCRYFTSGIRKSRAICIIFLTRRPWKRSPNAERSSVKDVEDDERRDLEAAGWRSKDHAGRVVWQNPESGYWYPQGVAIAMLREGADP